MDKNWLVQINESLVFAIILTAWVIYRVIRNLTIEKVDLAQEVFVNLAFVYGCLVFKVTFFPMIIVLYAFDPYDSNLVPLVRTIQMIQNASLLGVIKNLFGNLVLLAPLGIFLPIFFEPIRQVRKIVVAGFLVSLSIELSQFILKVRIFDVDDLIFNTLGVLVGFLVFLLFNKVSALSGLFARLSSKVRRGWNRAFTAYSLFTLLGLLSIYTYQIVQQTETRTAIINTLPSTHQTLLATPKFGDFMFVFSQSDQGDKSYAIYRRVFFNRFTVFEWGDLHLDENNYQVSGMSTGDVMNYFVIARSNEKAVSMISENLTFPLVNVGDYYFSYARFPLNQSDRYFSFHFLGSQKNDLELSMEH